MTSKGRVFIASVTSGVSQKQWKLYIGKEDGYNKKLKMEDRTGQDFANGKHEARNAAGGK